MQTPVSRQGERITKYQIKKKSSIDWFFFIRELETVSDFYKSHSRETPCEDYIYIYTYNEQVTMINWRFFLRLNVIRGYN